MRLCNYTTLYQNRFTIGNVNRADKSLIPSWRTHLPIVWFILSRYIWVGLKNILTNFLIWITQLRNFQKLSFMESIFLEPLDEQFIKNIPLADNLLLLWWPAVPPYIFIIVLLLFDWFHSHTIRINLRPNYFSLCVKHQTPI